MSTEQGIERYEVTGNPRTGQPEMVRSPNPFGGGWVRYTDYQAERDRLVKTLYEGGAEALVMAVEEMAEHV